MAETEASLARWVTAAMRARGASSIKSWSVHKSSETMRRGGSACASSAVAKQRTQQRPRRKGDRTALRTRAASRPAIVLLSRRRALFGPTTTKPIWSSERQLDAGKGCDRSSVEAKGLLILLIEQILYSCEELDARLQFVGGGGVDDPVGVRVRRAVERR